MEDKEEKKLEKVGEGEREEKGGEGRGGKRAKGGDWPHSYIRLQAP